MTAKDSIRVFAIIIVSTTCYAQRLGWSEIDDSKVTAWLVEDPIKYQSVYSFEEIEMGDWEIIILKSSQNFCAQRKSNDLGGDEVMITRNYYRNLANVRIEGNKFYSEEKRGEFVHYDNGQEKVRGLRLYDTGDSGSYLLGLSKSTLQSFYEGKYTQASTRILKSEELAKLSKAELQFMRNEIFARYGYEFVSGGKMDTYFRKQPWYQVLVDDNQVDINTRTPVLEMLTDLENENIDRIKEAEN